MPCRTSAFRGDALKTSVPRIVETCSNVSELLSPTPSSQPDATPPARGSRRRAGHVLGVAAWAVAATGGLLFGGMALTDSPSMKSTVVAASAAMDRQPAAAPIGGWFARYSTAAPSGRPGTRPPQNNP